MTATGARLEEDKVRPLLRLLQLKVCADGSGSDDIGLQKRQRLAGKSMFTHLQFGDTHTQYVTYMFFSPHMMRVSGAFFLMLTADASIWAAMNSEVLKQVLSCHLFRNTLPT